MQAIRGLELSRRYYQECVGPILTRRWPHLTYSAALIGSGSEVLGYDDSMSRDHHWGPRVMLFLSTSDQERYGGEITQHLADSLPYTFSGYPTNFSPPDPADNGTQLLHQVDSGPVRHRVEVLDLESYLSDYLGIDGPPDAYDWLTLPQQKLRSLVSGAVFHDGLPAPQGWSPATANRTPAPRRESPASSGTDATSATGCALAAMRKVLSYYPHDAWLYQMAAVWARIGQEEHLMGRAGIVDDEVGSALLGSRLVRDVMRLGFLVERQYAPYPKWFGTAFKALHCGQVLYPILTHVLHAADWRAREGALVRAYEIAAQLHNELSITHPLPTRARQFFGRPFRVLAIEGFSDALLEAIDPSFLDEVLRRSPIGGIDVFSDNTDLLEDSAFQPAVRALYRHCT